MAYNGEPFWTGFAETDFRPLLIGAGFADEDVISTYEPMGAGRVRRMEVAVMTSEVDALMSSPERLPAFIKTTSTGGLVSVVVRLAMEISVLRDRLDVYEALAEHHGVGGETAIEAFQPTRDMTARRMKRRARLVELLVRNLTAVE